jgi:hypothetical protein
MGLFKSEDEKKREHDAKMANWHSGLGRHGEDDAPPPIPGTATTVSNERVYTAKEAAKMNFRPKDIKTMKTGRDGKVTIVFKPGKAPPH